MRAILLGGGKTVFFLARQFIEKDYHTTLVVRDPVEAQTLSRRLERAVVVLGDGSHPATLEEAGARRADVLIALMPHDQDNLIACQAAKRMFGVPRTITLVGDPENETAFEALGVSIALSATKILATLIEEQTGFEEITNLIPLAEGEISVSELLLRSEEPGIGQRLMDLELPSDSLVAALIRNDRVLVPQGATRLEPGDRVLLISTADSFEAAVETLVGETGP